MKDNFDIKGQVTCAGSLALAHNVATSDSAVVDNLQAVGVVIIAKATMVEFAFRDGGSSWGYSSLGGQPLNPYDSSYETSGSSAGSGIAAAAALAAITFGGDTGGSVIPLLRGCRWSAIVPAPA
ncbi:amidase family protein [Microbacterium pumilum]|uniref:Amidase domain-containing protein n=1 Tax=Microbacterium pumilum TaxID=344165 RepID=A0ABP5EIM0_9MICO